MQCPKNNCAEQYCNKCVQAIQGFPPVHPFSCTACKAKVVPYYNTLLQKHVIWKNMCKLYGSQSLIDFKTNLKFDHCAPILRNLEFRVVHLQSRLKNLLHRFGSVSSCSLSDEELINDVDQLCKNLENLADEMRQTNEQLEYRGIRVNKCLESYKLSMKGFHRLCDALLKHIENLEMNNEMIVTEMTIIHEENIRRVHESRQKYIEQMYNMDHLDKLSSEQNLKAIDDFLRDLCFRRNCLVSRLKIIMSLLDNKTEQNETLTEDINKANNIMVVLTRTAEELTDLRGYVRAIENYADQFNMLLRDDKFQDIPCSKFILLLEKLRIRTEELEMINNFPRSTQLIDIWRRNLDQNNEPKPKALDLFKSIELDLNDLLKSINRTYSIAYKVGVIGEGSCGKSALIMNLADTNEFASMIDPERSTFGYLQCDSSAYTDPRNNAVIPFTFVDMEGATDTDESRSTGNYLELINKADCDLYIIVFDKLFSNHNRIWQDYIETKLERKCLLVRSKADELFKGKLQSYGHKRYDKNRTSKYIIDTVINGMKTYAHNTFDDERLTGEIYLTAADCDDDLRGESFSEFDMAKLKGELVRLAIEDDRSNRIQKLGIFASITIINTKFRRMNIVSKMRYQVLAAAGTILPFLDELPSFIGREQIRQTIGVHDRSWLSNKFTGTQDTLRQYLENRKLSIPAKFLQSGVFSYLKLKEKRSEPVSFSTNLNANVPNEVTPYTIRVQPIYKHVPTIAGHFTSNVGRSTAVFIPVIGMTDDVLHAMIPISVTAVRGVSYTAMGVGLALSVGYAIWIYHRTGKRMDNHIHKLCDDLVIVLAYLVADICRRKSPDENLDESPNNEE